MFVNKFIFLFGSILAGHGIQFVTGNGQSINLRILPISRLTHVIVELFNFDQNSCETQLKERTTSKQPRILNAGFIIFDEIDILDLAAPLEILSTAYYPALEVPDVTYANNPTPLINCFIIADNETSFSTQHLKMRRDYNFLDLESKGVGLDILIVPGGSGAMINMKNEKMLSYIRDFVNGQSTNSSFPPDYNQNTLPMTTKPTTPYKKERWLMSICTGSMLLGKAGVLNGLKASTHHGLRAALSSLQMGVNKIMVTKDRVTWSRKSVDGKGCNIITSGGVSSGLDSSLFLVKKLYGNILTEKIAKWIEYDYKDVL